MNTKLVVTALVLIVAVPILMGYGMAFQDVTRDSWDASDDRAITGLLYNDESWTYLSANSYTMNDQVLYANGQYSNPYYFKTQTSPVTSLPVTITSIASQSNYLINMAAPASGTFSMSSALNIDLTLKNGNTTFVTIYDVQSAQFSDGTFYGVYKSGDDLISYSYSASSFDTVYFSRGIIKLIHNNPAAPTRYADPVYGWQINQSKLYADDVPIQWTLRDMKANQIIMTIDFGPTMGRMSNGDLTLNYQALGGPAGIPILIHKETSNCYMEINGTRVPIMTSGGTFSTAGNVWQLVLDQDKYTWNYVKDWPGQFGLMPAYYTLDIPYSGGHVDYITGLLLADPGLYNGIDPYGPRYRADFVSFRSSPFPVINNKTYDPLPLVNGSSYRLTFDDISLFGDAISFGGRTFNVTKDSITLPDGVKVKVDDIRLESRVKDGIRTNYINNIELSEGDTALTMSGKWGSIVVLDQLTYNEVTSTEWVAGEWAWNGVDASFGLIGLITCVAVFIGLGMYGARSGAKVGTLMLICGAAALIFIALI